MTEQMAKVYNPHEVEKKWYAIWQENGWFAACDHDRRPVFSIVMPPPNVTGSLHLGHALNNTLPDIFVRYKRMRGYNALWLPGTDHAGIATQIKVEEMLATEGFSRYDLGREAFVERVWQWKHQYGDTIIRQLKSLGCSCDWQRERFTMDEGCSRAVREVFVRLYEKGLIYRGQRITNWCPRCRTALSDIEVEYSESDSKLYYVRYPLADQPDRFITVATTRPETILGDTAVAVNPRDRRYDGWVGRQLRLPVIGRLIPIIADDHVDQEFGSGAVKVTPAHDPNDFEIGGRHQLPAVTVIGQDGRMTGEAGKYAELDRYECRRQLLEELTGLGLLDKVVEHKNSVGHCDRCDTVVEPLLSRQWFVRMKPLAEPAIRASEERKVEFIPDRFRKIYNGWLENIRDWCISRQIWWGHRIPAWYCDQCGATLVSRDDLTACLHCRGKVRQEEDVLDTWFSSALWPFSTLGWPDDTPALRRFYPTSLLITGYDIIFFWVARMVFTGLEFMDDVPFRQVLLTGLIRDGQGRKMSKSLGNGIDPLEIIDRYGADTLRFSLVTGNTPGNDMRFYMEKVESSRNFANKIWNAARFVRMNLTDGQGRMPTADELALTGGEQLSLADRWILSRLATTAAGVTRNLDKLESGEAARQLYDFIWSEFCDWYIELAKPHLQAGQPDGQRAVVLRVLYTVLKATMEMLHPYMPFITEEIWQHLPHDGPTIMLAGWPDPPAGWCDGEADAAMAAIMEAVRAVRNLRAEMDVPPGRKSPIVVMAINEYYHDLFNRYGHYLTRLAAGEGLAVIDEQAARPDNAVSAVVAAGEVFLPLRGLIDVSRELARLDKEQAGYEAEQARLSAKLANPGFVARAPAAVVEKERQRLQEAKERLRLIRQRRDYLRRL
ncbi:MAG: valine--tRNA ligase [Negativicutes bacterium]|nr:valine--tRNA ligase [Negativicutes bacterium]